MNHRAVAPVAILVTLLLTLVSCGTDGDRDVEDATASEHELLTRVSAALQTRPARSGVDAVAYADLAAAREQLGLPAGAAISGRGKHRLLLSFATRPLFRFSMTFTPRPSLGSLGAILDSREIEAVAGTNFAFSGPLSDQIRPEDAIVIRTGQSFDEIAAALREMDYEEDADGLLVGSEPLGPEETRLGSDPRQRIAFPAVGATDGVVVFAGSAQAARAALDGARSELTPAARLVAELPGVSRAAAGREVLFGRCVTALGLGEDAAPREGVLVVLVDGEAEGRRHRFSGQTQPTTFFDHAGGYTASEDEIEFARATAEGGRAEARFSSTDELNATRLGIESVQRPYECPQSTD